MNDVVHHPVTTALAMVVATVLPLAAGAIAATTVERRTRGSRRGALTGLATMTAAAATSVAADALLLVSSLR